MDLDKKIEIIYNQAQEKRKQAMMHPEGKFDPFLIIGKDIDTLGQQLYLLWSDVNFPRKNFDVLQKSFVKMLNFIIMNTDPVVIDALINEEIITKAKKKFVSDLK